MLALLLIPVVVAIVLVSVVGSTWIQGSLSSPRTTFRPAPPLFTVPMLDVAPGSAVPAGVGPVPASVAGPNDPRIRWIAAVSANSDIPRRALTAYVGAAAVTAARNPGCHLSWTTLAGVARAESMHGRYHGDSIGPDGVQRTAITGPALDGSPGRKTVPDTDHGTLDGDPVWDHALGPLQFLPSTWAKWGVRASGDGRPADPQDIDDAALTAARYLCASGGDLGGAAGWWAAMFVYNNSSSYGREVFSDADAYARVSHRIPV